MQHHHSDRELGHNHDGNLATFLPDHFFDLTRIFNVDVFNILQLNDLCHTAARRPLMMVELIFSSEVMFLRVTVCCCVDSEDDTIGYGCVQFCNRKNYI